MVPTTTSSTYCIYVVTDKKRQNGSYRLVIKSDHELVEGKTIKPLVKTTSLSSVWMKRITGNEPPGFPTFNFTLAKNSYCSFHLSIPREQRDNIDNFTVDGTLSLLIDDCKLEEWSFSIQREGNAAEFHIHLKKYVKYTIQTNIISQSMDRDVIFDITLTSIMTAEPKFEQGAINHLYFFRLLEDFKQKPSIAEPYPWGGSFAECKAEWTSGNSGGDDHYFDDYPQFIITLAMGKERSPKIKVRVTLEHVDKSDNNQPPLAFYVYDIDDYLRAHKSTHRVVKLIQHRFSIKGENNQDKLQRLLRSAPSKDVHFIEEIVEANCDWDLTPSKYLLIVPASLRQRKGYFRITAQCVDFPIVRNRTLALTMLSDKWFEHCQTFKASWIGCGGGDIGGDLFIYNPCFEIKISVPDTQVVCKMVNEGTEDPNERVAMYLFEPEVDQEHVFLSRNLKFKCEWNNSSRVLLSATLNPEIIESEPLVSVYYLVCSTKEEQRDLVLDLKIYSSKPVTVRQVR